MIRKKLLSAIDPGFIHHAEYTKDLPKRNFTGAKYKGLLFKSIKGKTQYAVEFRTNSATFPGEKMHTQRVALLKLRELLQAKEPRPTLMRDKVLKAIAEGDMLIGCTCEAFLYWGYAYICTHMQVAYPDFKENRPPKIRNPLMRGIMCKHLNLVLSVLPFNATNIVSNLKKKELD